MSENLNTLFHVPTSDLNLVMVEMGQAFRTGLNYDDQNIKMIPSYVKELPTGHEVEKVLALDLGNPSLILGGTNFRVLLVSLEGEGKVSSRQAKFAVTEEQKKANGTVLFDFFAAKVHQFILAENIGEIPHSLGFTFSFPVYQTAIDQGYLIHWAKGFENEGVINCDVVQLLQQAFIRKGLDINIVALLNDPVGTLTKHAYRNTKTSIAVILGTGTNAAYVEEISNIKKLKSNESGHMIVNTEWGGFSGSSLPINRFDIALDRSSENPGKQIYEKMISGLYLGELTRLVLVHLADDRGLFHAQVPNSLRKAYSFQTAYMSQIEMDTSDLLLDVSVLLRQKYEIESSFVDRQVVKYVCQLIGMRAAQLAAAGIATLVRKIDQLDDSTVAVDGSLYAHYPGFEGRMRDTLFELLGSDAGNIKIEHATDGSGQGAGILAALHKTI